MTSVSALNHIHKTGLFGNHESKTEKNLLEVSEVKNMLIVQIVQFKSSTVSFENIDIDNLKLKNLAGVRVPQQYFGQLQS